MPKKKEKNSFENDINRLEEISNLLEDENLDLEEALILFEEGITLSKNCLESLNKAELKITELKKKLNINNNEADLFDE